MSFRSVQNTDATFRNVTITGKLSVPGETSYPTDVELDKITSVDGTNVIDLSKPDKIDFNSDNSYFNGNVVLSTGHIDMSQNYIQNVGKISGYNGILDIASGNQLYLQGYGNLNNCKEQGAYLDWNDGSGDGKMNLICNRGGGHGGFSFYNVHNASDGTVDPATTKEVIDVNGSGDMILYSTTDSVAGSLTDAGALIVKGGACIDKNLDVGSIDVRGVSAFDGVATVTNTTDATTTASGAFSVKGGASISKQLRVTGVTTILNTTDSTTINNGALVVDGGIGCEKSLQVGGSATINSVTDATSSSTGALIVDGGASIVKQLRVGGVTTLSGTTPSTSATTGELVVGGGVGIGSTSYINGDLHITGSLYGKSTISDPNGVTHQEFHWAHVTGNNNTASSNGAVNLYYPQGNSNYMVFPAVYDGFTGSGGTYDVPTTAGAISTIVISEITPTSFAWVFKKNTGDNVNVYVVFNVVFSNFCDFPKTYSS